MAGAAGGLAAAVAVSGMYSVAGEGAAGVAMAQFGKSGVDKFSGLGGKIGGSQITADAAIDVASSVKNSYAVNAVKAGMYLEDPSVLGYKGGYNPKA